MNKNQTKGKYSFLLWDVDNTLLDFSYSERESLTKCLLERGLPAGEPVVSLYSAINDGWWKRLEQGEVTKKQVQIGRFQDFFAKMGISMSQEEQFVFQEHYQQNLGIYFSYLEDSLSLCKELQEKGYHQYIVTNGDTNTQRQKLKAAGFTSLMEGIFISETIGTPKPGKAFFQACFDEISQYYPAFSLEQTLIIGDSYTSDMAGGKTAGIDTCWYHKGDRDNSVTYQIESLWDIFSVLGEERKDG